MNLTKEQVLKISKGDEEIAAFIQLLLDQNALLEARVKELERQLGTDSRNSSKPPSSDGLRKPKSLRPSGGKKGAPNGHKGHTLKMADKPDHIEYHEPAACGHCHHSLAGVPVDTYEKRQVADIPPPHLVFTEHRAAAKRCPHCHKSEKAAFPKEVNAPIQYGEGWGAWCAYLHMYQLLPLNRTAELFQDLTGHRPSEGTLLARLEKFNDRLQPIEAAIKAKLTASDVVHADETGTRVEGKLNWLHTVSDDHWTMYLVHLKRGKEAMDAMGILPFYKGVVVHDFWKSYFQEVYSFKHALCGVHLLRECQGIIDYDKHRWAGELQALLREALQAAEQAAEAKRSVEPAVIASISSRYDAILDQGRPEWHMPPDPGRPKQRGRIPKSKAGNLAERFITYKADILRFLTNDAVPFSNNQAERDVRMAKVKLKIAGCFRTEKGAAQFARIRGFISTARKQGLDLIESLISVSRGEFSFS